MSHNKHVLLSSETRPRKSLKCSFISLCCPCLKTQNTHDDDAYFASIDKYQPHDYVLEKLVIRKLPTPLFAVGDDLITAGLPAGDATTSTKLNESVGTQSEDLQSQSVDKIINTMCTNTSKVLSRSPTQQSEIVIMECESLSADGDPSITVIQEKQLKDAELASTTPRRKSKTGLNEVASVILNNLATIHDTNKADDVEIVKAHKKKKRDSIKPAEEATKKHKDKSRRSKSRKHSPSVEIIKNESKHFEPPQYKQYPMPAKKKSPNDPIPPDLEKTINTLRGAKPWLSPVNQYNTNKQIFKDESVLKKAFRDPQRNLIMPIPPPSTSRYARPTPPFAPPFSPPPRTRTQEPVSPRTLIEKDSTPVLTWRKDNPYNTFFDTIPANLAKAMPGPSSYKPQHLERKISFKLSTPEYGAVSSTEYEDASISAQKSGATSQRSKLAPSRPRSSEEGVETRTQAQTTYCPYGCENNATFYASEDKKPGSRHGSGGSSKISTSSGKSRNHSVQEDDSVNLAQSHNDLVRGESLKWKIIIKHRPSETDQNNSGSSGVSCIDADSIIDSKK